ncbi:MAG: F0F1 ATP synthase subunit A [Bacteroidales bacterium]|nr:F0F1 ATP synthase subunit A [Bacteroidales bacterium]
MRKTTYNYRLLFAFILMFSFTSFTVHASEEREKLDAGALMIDHIIDSHDWHIYSIGDKHVSIPLPIIILENGKLSCFMSSKFEHGHATYKGYALPSEGPNKGKIIKVDEEGNKDESAIIYDFSITKNALSIMMTSVLIFFLFYSVAKTYKRNPNKAPKGLQSVIEIAIIFVRDDIAKASIGPKYTKYLPYLLTLFFFIIINNLVGLIPIFPGGANVTGNITVCAVLALFTFFIIIFTGNRNYWQHMFNTPGVPWWLKIPLPLMPIIEILGALTKPFVLMVRLFANITAGHIIGLGFITLILVFGEMSTAAALTISPLSVILYMFIGLLELLVAFLQAYVFTLLTAIFFGMAVEEHHKEVDKQAALIDEN